MDAIWSDPRHVLGVVERLLAVPRQELYVSFSAEFRTLLPHRAAAIQTADCPRSPLAVDGDPAIAAAVTSTELLRLAGRGEPGTALLTDGLLAGTVRRLILIASHTGALLVLVPDGPDPGADALELAGRLWSVLSADQARRVSEQGPDLLAGNLAAAAARARTITDLGQTYATTLTALQAVLRSGRLTDAAARRTAVDLAADALIDLRAVARRDQELSSETAAESFAALERQLAYLLRHTEVEITLAGPGTGGVIPQDIAHAARTVTRGLVVAAVGRQDVRRVRASWRLDHATLHVTVRDDGPDVTEAVPAAPGLTEWITGTGGRWEIDTVPGWGTTMTVALPLTVDAPAGARPLDRLNPREVEVLSGIAEGLRNRGIAERLRLSEHTVKFHVRNILEKLEVTSRGEAAALARRR
ncbi:LuxR C-terminal-related transcriptional regulator [Catenuloplanes sp. NPDC051500]|uniref:helix-turn-helix transcriptional regulator n=1 Tax=Catenuloplanes sp. NPDC051500 TaxID=3363959 RepID=UPI0037B1E67D